MLTTTISLLYATELIHYMYLVDREDPFFYSQTIKALKKNRHSGDCCALGKIGKWKGEAQIHVILESKFYYASLK